MTVDPMQQTIRIITLTLATALLCATAAEAGKKSRKERKAQAEAEQVERAPSSTRTEPAEQGSLWADPRFQDEFVGTFGVNSEIEPQISPVEYETLEKLRPLLDLENEEEERQAVEMLEEITATDPHSAVFDFYLGNVHFQQDRLEAAIPAYERAIDGFPSFRRAHKNLGLIHVRRGDCALAVPPLTRVVELGGNDGLLYGLLGQCYNQLEQYISAESAFRSAMLLQPDRLHWKLGLTQAILRQEKYAEALALSRQLIDDDPDRADYWMLQANAFIGLGRALDAAANYEIVRRMGKATRQSLYTLGDVYVNENLWDLAADAYVEAFRADPDQDLARPLRSVEVLAQRNALEQARQLLLAARTQFADRLDEDQQKRMLKLEARIAVADEAGGDAVAVLEEIVALDPLDGEALVLLGQHYERNDDRERAIFYYERAMSIDDYEADASLRKAQVLVAEARFAEALPLLKRAQEIEPRDNVARYLEQVERIARSRQ